MTSVFNDQYESLTLEFVEQYDNGKDELESPFKLPTLYTYTKSTGKYKVYNVGFDGKSLVTEYGQMGGKMIISRRDVVPKVKRTLYQQAYQEVHFRWNKKLKQRYTTDIDQASSLIQKQVMLANKYDSSKVTKFPVYGQIKYDGMRFIAYLEQDKVVLRSRAGNPFENLDHISIQLEPVLRTIQCPLDGELIVPNHDFQEVSSRIKGKTNNDTVIAVIFDIMANEGYAERWDSLLKKVPHLNLMGDIFGDVLDDLKDPDISDVPDDLKDLVSNSVYLIDNYELNNEKEINELFQDAIRANQEGIMIRSLDESYFNGRCNQVMKLKSLETDEGIILDVVDGTGSHKDLAIFVLQDSLNVTTHVVPAATVDQRRSWYIDKDQLIGKSYRFAFNERMSDTNAPRNPTGLGFV